jgi:acetolactate synthase-1/3 small subunit
MKRNSDLTYTLTLTVRNTSGVLVRCAQIFNRRGHNIETLHVAAVPDSSTMSLMTITAFGKPGVTQQITMQLRRLIDVTSVTEKEQ